MATHTTLNSLFTDIADEIRAKKGTSETIVADNFPDEIANLPSGGDPSEYFNIEPTAEEMANTQYWVNDKFVKKTPVLTIPSGISDISYLCASATDNNLYMCPKIICNNTVTNMNSLYSRNYSNIIDITGLNTTNVSYISSMFFKCINVEEIDLSTFDLNRVYEGTTYRGDVFNGCYNLKKVIVTSMIKGNLYKWFYSCYSLKTLVLLKTDGICEWGTNTFRNCYHMDGTVNATYNPQGLKDGRIYVPDALVNDYKTASGWSTYADQILPLSQYVEE